jgi:cell division protein FtsZ
MGGRAVTTRRPTPAGRTKTPFTRTEVAATSTPAPEKTSGADRPAEPELIPAAMTAEQAKTAQEEFGFGEVESRGHFEKTDRNLFDGQDLDVPTYLRKGIKITL